MSEPGTPAGCAAFDEDLSAWLDGELAAERGAAVRAHVERCARCTARAEALRAVDLGLRALADAAPGAAESERLARLRARVSEGVGGAAAGDRHDQVSEPSARSGRRAASPRRRRPAVWVGAAAAALLAALAVPRVVERAVPTPAVTPLAERSEDLAMAPPRAVAPEAAPPAARPTAPAPDAALADAPAEAFAAQASRSGGFGASAEAGAGADPADAAAAAAPGTAGGVDPGDLDVVARLDALLREATLSPAERAALRAPLDAARRARLPENLARWRALPPEQQAEVRAAWARVRAAAGERDPESE